MDLNVTIAAYPATFTVFFAVAWGSIANVLPSWKPFDSSPDPRISARRRLSRWWLDVCPIMYYVFVMTTLSMPQFGAPANVHWAARVVIHAFALGLCIFLARAMYGFYRVWLGKLELSPNAYYYQRDDNYYTHKEGGVSVQKLDPTIAAQNLKMGIRNIVSWLST